MHFNYYRLEMSQGRVEIKKQKEGRARNRVAGSTYKE